MKKKKTKKFTTKKSARRGIPSDFRQIRRKKKEIVGAFSSSSSGFGFVTPAEEYNISDDIFIPARAVGTAMHGDIVAVKISKAAYQSLTESKNDGLHKAEGEIVEIKSRAVTKLCGTLIENQDARFSKYCVRPDNMRYSFLVEVEDAGGASVGDKVLVEITKYSSGRIPPKGVVIKSYGDSESRYANYEAILFDNGIETEFSPAAVKEAEQAARETISTEGRLDLRGKIIFTIDGADAKDLDDAISLEMSGENYLLGVHIADVSHYVKFGSLLDKEALERGTSVYFVDKVVPMLPTALSNGACSLNAGTEKYALSALITLDKEGKIISCEVKNSIIKSAVRGVYSEVNDIFERGKSSEFYDKYKLVYGVLLKMFELYKQLSKNSISRGVLDFESDEAYFVLDDAGMPVDVIRRTRGDAEKLIEQFMLCANEAVAKKCSDMKIPCVYRIHEAPDAAKLLNFKNFAHNIGLDVSCVSGDKVSSANFLPILKEAEEKGFGAVVSRMALRAQMKAKYSNKRAGHFGLALDYYCHFTSPIRRYPDLSVHRILKYAAAVGAEDCTRLFARFAYASAKQSSDTELKAMTAERDITDLYRALYMGDKIGCVFDAIISSVTSFGFFAELENTCEGLIKISELDGHFMYDEKGQKLISRDKTYKLGDTVKVVITDADVIARRVCMRVCD